MSGKSRSPKQSQMCPVVQQPAPAPQLYPGMDPSLYGNSFMADQLMQGNPEMQPQHQPESAARTAKRVVGGATALPKANNISRLVKGAGLIDKSRAAPAVRMGNPLNAMTEAQKVQASKSAVAYKAMKDSNGGGMLKQGSKLGNLGKAAGVAGGLLTAATGAKDIADGKDENGEKYLQVVEGGLGTAGAASGNPYLASASTGMMLARSSNDYYKKHTGKSISDHIGDATGSAYGWASNGLKESMEGTSLEGSVGDGIAEGAGLTLGAATFVGGTVLGAAASIGGGIVGIGDSIFGD